MNKFLEKLSSIQWQLSIQKDWKNPFFKSKYITLDNILDKLNPLLIEHKLCVINRNKECWVETTIYCIETKESMTSQFVLNQQSDPQKLWSIITYWRRYNLTSIFNIIADEDDDGNSFSNKSKDKEKDKEKKKDTKTPPLLFWEELFKRLEAKKESYKDAKTAIAEISQKYVIPEDVKQRIEKLYFIKKN